ncbi:MAG: glycoside hydrolase family 13 protein [Oscillospiraceae bacterium]
MFDKETFDSRSPRYKTPFGAVPGGTEVFLTLRPARRSGFVRGLLTARFELRDNALQTAPIVWTGTGEGRDVFSCTLETGDYVGLIFYSFSLTGSDGRTLQSEEYQLTVYDGKAAPVPLWFGEGMSYQIFPDRFCRTEIPDPAGMVGGRTVHQNWEEEPIYHPDENGEVRNRDFFGGNLAGILEKLPYLQKLGVETLYFCPLFEAAENHRYGTADYEKIDPMLGTNEDFTALCTAAHKLGLRVMVDGVFNHVGFVSRYFNGDGFYGTGGASKDQNSPFFPWFKFTHWPDKYEAWWGFYTLPDTQEEQPSYRDYIIENKNSIIARWLRAGADAWRLDVADELPDDFVAAVNAAAKRVKPDAVVIGEVWEDGTTKIAYDVRRKHILGGHCDGLMNYPLRAAIVSYLLGGSAGDFEEAMETLREHYPRDSFYSCMNALGTHDTPRIFTLLGVGQDYKDKTKAFRADFRLNPEQRTLAEKRLTMGLTALFCFPGSPMVYYGDETEMEGFEDPFNRRTFPWGRENTPISAHITRLGTLRKTEKALRSGDISYPVADRNLLCFARILDGETVAAALNNGKAATLTLPWATATDLLTGEVFSGESIPMAELTSRVLKKG